MPGAQAASALLRTRLTLPKAVHNAYRLILFKVSHTLMLMNTPSPLLVFVAAVIMLFFVRLMFSPRARGSARHNIVTLAQRRPHPTVQVAVMMLLWLASLAFAVDLVAHFAVEAPEALRPLYRMSTIAAIVSFTLAALLWNFGTRTVSFFPPDSDRRLAAEAERLGIPTEEVVMRTLDRGLPQLIVKSD